MSITHNMTCADNEFTESEKAGVTRAQTVNSQNLRKLECQILIFVSSYINVFFFVCEQRGQILP